MKQKVNLFLATLLLFLPLAGQEVGDNVVTIPNGSALVPMDDNNTLSSITVDDLSDYAATRLTLPDGDAEAFCLLIGQSNMQGGEPNANVQNLTATPLVQIHNTTTGLFEDWNPQTPAVNQSLGTLGGGETASLAWQISRELSKGIGPVKSVVSSRGGQALNYWGCNIDGSFNASAEGWQKVLDGLAVVPRIDFIFFHQGESSVGATDAERLANQNTMLDTLFTQLYAHEKIADSTPFFFGENLGGNPSLFHENIYRPRAAASARIHFVENSRRPVVIGNVHYDPQSLYNLGRDYAEAALEQYRDADSLRQSLRERWQSREILAVDTQAFGDAQPEYSLRVTTNDDDNPVRLEFELLLEEIRINSLAVSKSRVTLAKRSEQNRWTLVEQSAGSGTYGPHIELANQTFTSCDLVIHHSGTTTADATYKLTVAKIDPYGLEPRYGSDETFALTKTVEDDSRYIGTSEAAPNDARDGGLLEPVYKYVGAFGTNRERYRISFSGLSTGNAIYRFQAESLIYIVSGARAAAAEIIISKRSAGYSIGVTGVAAGVHGLHLETENRTTTSFDLVIQNVYSNASSSWGQEFGLCYQPSLLFPQPITFSGVAELEDDPDYLPGGAGASDF